MKQFTERPKVEGTGRVEAFSDGVLAIIVTLLIFEVHVPELNDLSTQGVLASLWSIAPKLISFAVSFFTVAIFWVNHHHFFSRVTHSDWKLLWLNNLLLFWLTVVPFTTAFIGDYPTVSIVVALYALTLCLAGASFSLMGNYVFFHSGLMPESVSLPERRSEFRRSLWATGLYGVAGLVALLWVQAALVMVAVIPFFYVVPRLLNRQTDSE
jgi:uncharacterized membrane protein